MAKSKAPTKKRGNASKSTFKGFINVAFSHDDQVAINGWIEQCVTEPYDAILGIAERGWKVSISYDDFKDVWTCSITGKRTHTSYDGYCIVVPHRNLDKVVLVALYVVEVMAEMGALSLPGDDDDLNW